MNNKSAIVLGFGLPLAFLFIIGVFVINPQIRTQPPATHFYYATMPAWRTQYYENNQKSPLFILGGKIAFQNITNNVFFTECQPTNQWIQNQSVSVVPNPLPTICLEKDRARLLAYAVEQGLKIYEHDTKLNQSILLSVDQVLALQAIDDNAKSPEGYTLETNGYYSGGNDLLFGGGSRYRSGAFLVNNRRRTEMNVRASTGDTGIHFLGWAR